ncbi:hypothetical protein [Salinarimonas chemoclinalis]|uniref:hypothetical protein n=1 Tax=Salinarimonas chemoclinalis TaxID=3241599 RepID=UPI0035565758
MADIVGTGMLTLLVALLAGNVVLIVARALHRGDVVRRIVRAASPLVCALRLRDAGDRRSATCRTRARTSPRLRPAAELTVPMDEVI